MSTGAHDRGCGCGDWVAAQTTLGLLAIHAAWSEVDAAYAEHLKSYMVNASNHVSVFSTDLDVHPARLLFGFRPHHASTKRIETVEGTELTLAFEDAQWWNEAVEVSLFEPGQHGSRCCVGVLHNNQTGEWLTYRATQDKHGRWDLQGNVDKNINRAAHQLTIEQRLAIGFPANPIVRPTGDELVAMFPPKAAAIKAAWAHDRQSAAQMDAAEFLAALSDTGRRFAHLQTRNGEISPYWTRDAGQSPTPFDRERWDRNFTRHANTRHRITATDTDRNPVEFDPASVKAWTDPDAIGYTGWRPVAMVTISISTVEKRTPRARTKFVRVTRYNAYGIAHHQTTGEWAVYNTVDTSTSNNWERGPDACTWDTQVVISNDINKAAAHLTAQQRVALGLPSEPVVRDSQ